MKRMCVISVLLVVLLVALMTPVFAQEKDACVEFKELVAKTYNFDEAKLSGEQKLAKEKELDSFWKTVVKRQKEWTPCLRAAIKDPKSNAFFRYDGSNLLVEIDPSSESKKLQIEIYTQTDLDTVGARRWLTTLTQLALEDFDISAAAQRWMLDKNAAYTIPEHGDYEVGALEGALFLYGSMDEAQATPSLIKIVADKKHPAREIALHLLLSQATPEALQFLQKLDATGFSEDARQSLRDFLDDATFILPREKPLISREKYLQVFEAFVKGDTKPFFDLVEKVEDGERDAIVVLKPEDLPLVRRVRRMFIAGGNQHGISYYYDFTSIILEVLKKSQAAQRA